MAAKSTAKKSSSAPTRMPIDDYDRLLIKEILPRLTILSGPELKVVAAHEKAGRNRVTLLRAVRKVELAREAALASSPTSHLTIVDDGPELVAVPVPEPVSVPEPEPVDDLPTLEVAKVTVPPEVTKVTVTPEVTNVTVAPEVTKVTVAPEVAKAKEKKEPNEAKESRAPRAPKTARPRTAAKHATWEEELRLELPRRIESMAYDLDPPIIAIVPDAPLMADSTPTGSSTPNLTRPARVRRRFEGAVLVMAAVLAVLLGLAIGTVLARTGSSTAQSSTPTAVTQAAAVPGAG